MSQVVSLSQSFRIACGLSLLFRWPSSGNCCGCSCGDILTPPPPLVLLLLLVAIRTMQFTLLDDRVLNRSARPINSPINMVSPPVFFFSPHLLSSSGSIFNHSTIILALVPSPVTRLSICGYRSPIGDNVCPSIISRFVFIGHILFIDCDCDLRTTSVCAES